MGPRAASQDLPMKALQRADALLGLAACALLQPLRALPRTRRGPGAARKVLAIKFWGIGSLQMLTPAAAALRRRHPGAEIALLTLAPNREFALGLGVFDRVLCADVACGRWSELLWRIAALALRLRRAGFDEVYDFEFFTRFSAVVSLLSGAGRTHGFAAPDVWRGGFHARTVPFRRDWHAARNFRALAGDDSGVQAEEMSPSRFFGQDTARVAALLSEHGLGAGRPYAVLNPNAGALSLERRWPQASFAELARRLALQEGLGVVLIGTASERAWTARVAELAGPRAAAVDLAGLLSARELAALLARAALVVSNDSGPMHLAAALGAPTIGLFGPETPEMYAPIGPRARALYRPPPCSPCINVHENKLASCLWGSPHCLTAIGVGEVLAAAQELIGTAEAHGEPAESVYAAAGR